jgi:hypothetical protein
MNDYLWDKSGEPDAEVERLENLLGSLRQERRPLELPPEIFVAHPRRRAAWFPYAAAAALALAALAGFWSFLAYRQNVTTGSRTIANASSEKTTEKTTATTAPNDAIRETATASNGNDNEGAQPKEVKEQFAPEKRHEQTSRVVTERKARQFVARRAPRRRENLDKREETRGTTQIDQLVASERERQTAKEQLMLALRLTSEKLRDVQRKTQTTNSQGTKPAPDEQNKLR